MDQPRNGYREHGDDWNGKTWRKTTRGVWKEWITWNENARWDWWEIGGRWPGRLRLKEPNEDGLSRIHFSWGWEPEQRQKFLDEHKDFADYAKKGNVANLEELTSYSLLIDGEWIDLGDIVGDDEESLRVYPYLKDLPDDVELVCIDYHM